MKRIFSFLLLMVCLQNIKAQYVTIPDANFVTWLQTNVPTAMNGNQMDTTSPAVTTRTIISVGFSGISNISGIEYFTSLINLNCTDNSLTSLPVLPNTIKNLNINRNQISNIITLPDSLIELDCGQNQLTSLPALPTKLKFLFCFINPLTALPSLPNSLQHLYCPSNQLSTLPPMPNSLTYIDCTHNQILSLPSLSTSLGNLYCSYNQLTNLPVLPNSLTGLYCQHNQLLSLPVLPVNLYRLDCSYNQLTSLPLLPTGLSILNCSHNNISCFPVFPNMTLQYIQGAGPPTKALTIDFNPFSCLPNYVGAMDTFLLNYPLCVSGNTLTNSNGCETGRGITGIVYRDLNTDCIKNNSETGITNAILRLYDNSNVFLGLTTTQLNNSYLFNVQSGTYKVILDTLNKPYDVQCINPGIDSLITLTSTQIVEDSVDFVIVCKPGFDIGVQSIYITGAAFPGITHTLTAVAGDLSHWANLNCASGLGGVVTLSVNGPVTYVGPAAGALTPNVTGNTYSYTIADFGSINNVTDFRLVFKTDTTVLNGDIICISATVTPIAGDNLPINNTLQYCYYAINSVDPNIKEVYPVIVQPNYTDWLTYTIHFQNTGNANAINIRLQDVLDAKLNPETFEVLSYSHDNVIDLTGNNLTVRFPNIQLPDSASNPIGSIGFIQYRIKPKAGWVNDTIRNSAQIYFDYNVPIVTNTAKTYFMTTTGIVDKELSRDFYIYPNPANSSIYLKITVDKPANSTCSVKITDVLGKEILNETYKEEIDISHLEKGIYFLSLYQNGSLLSTKKMVKD